MMTAENEKLAIKQIEAFKKAYGVHITTGHEGKMTNVWSLSTSSLMNPICIARAKDEKSICHYCYAKTLEEYRQGLHNCLVRNFNILTTQEICVDLWPYLYETDIFRLESFGDVANEVQVNNYINFCRANPETRFAAWTKNPEIYAKAFQLRRKPKNLRIVLSSPYMDKIASKDKYPFVDKVFTVWSSEDKCKEEHHRINCGARSCDKCRRCYLKDFSKHINEIKK